MTTEAIETIKLRKHVLKGCERCGGDLLLEHDGDVLFGRNPYSYVCLQCGRYTSVRSILNLARPAIVMAAA